MGRPIVSIILPSLRPFHLAQCLKSIERYTAGIEYDVVVISPFDIKPHPNVVHVKEAGPDGVYKAVLSGYEQAKGEYIIHIPDDSRATPYWAENMVAFMRPHDVEIFEGNFRHFDARGERPEPGIYGKPSAPFLCIRKDKANIIGGLMDCYYKSFWGDHDLSLRVWHNGGKVETCPNAWVYHADCNDEVHESSYNRYFIHDQQSFVRRWHHIYARPGETKIFYTSQPIKERVLSFELPPEECVKLYISIQGKDWKTVENIVMANNADACLYPEGLPVLYNLVIQRLKSPFNPKKTLYMVLDWLWAKGFVPAPHDIKSEENLLVHQRVWNFGTEIARRVVRLIRRLNSK